VRRWQPRHTIGRDLMGVKQPMIHVRLIKVDHVKITPANTGFGKFHRFTLADHTSNYNWDYYRINKVVVQYIPDQTPTFIRSTIDILGGSVIDYDQQDTPTNLKSLVNQQTFQMFTGSWGFSRCFRPRATEGVEGRVSGSTAYSLKAAGVARPGQWINTKFNDVPHNGLAVWIDGYTGTGDPLIGFKIITKMYVSFKGPLTF